MTYIFSVSCPILRGTYHVLAAPVVLSNPNELSGLLGSAGINRPSIDLRIGTVTFSTLGQFVDMEVKGTPLRDLIDGEGYQGPLNEAQEALQQFIVESDEVVIPMDAISSRRGKMVRYGVICELQ